MRLLFVCLGNICRSPTAESVMRTIVEREGLDREMAVDSAGTAAWHVGKAPDARSIAAAAQRGITVSGAARQVTARDACEGLVTQLCAQGRLPDVSR